MVLGGVVLGGVVLGSSTVKFIGKDMQLPAGHCAKDDEHTQITHSVNNTKQGTVNSQDTANNTK